MSEPQATAQQPAPTAENPPIYTLITAGALLALFIGLTIAMMAHFAGLGADTDTWKNALLIYNSFTAFAVAAGGVLLGTQIQQVNVAAARRTAAEAKQEASEAKSEAKSAEVRSERVRDAALAAFLAAEPDDAALAPEPRLSRVRSLLAEAVRPAAATR